MTYLEAFAQVQDLLLKAGSFPTISKIHEGAIELLTLEKKYEHENSVFNVPQGEPGLFPSFNIKHDCKGQRLVDLNLFPSVKVVQ